MPSQPPSLFAALGYSRAVERDYHRALAQSGRELVSVAEVLLRSPEQLLQDLQALIDAGIVRVEDARVHVATPPEAVAMLLRKTADESRQAGARLADLARAIPHLAAPAAGPGPGEVSDVHPLDGEISSGGNPVPLLRALIAGSAGDLLWLRPEHFPRAREEAMAAIVGEAVARGRASRAIYPYRALSEGWDSLELRRSAGEQIRLLPDLPSRMLVIGTTHAVLPEPLGFADQPRSLVRQAGLVQGLSLWFEALWEKASPLPQPGEREGGGLRGFLLQQLAGGARDEQIARTLGVSLRTVRRRIAALMTELGAESRFQAGVEAVRRGWL